MPLSFHATVGDVFRIKCELNDTAIASGHVFKAQVFDESDLSNLKLVEERQAPAQFDFKAPESKRYLFACYDQSDRHSYKILTPAHSPAGPITREVGECEGRRYDISVTRG